MKMTTFTTTFYYLGEDILQIHYLAIVYVKRNSHTIMSLKTIITLTEKKITRPINRLTVQNEL